MMRTYVKEYFESMSQVLFFKNAYFGAIFVILSLTFKFDIFFCGILASCIGYFYSQQSRTPKILRQAGLMSINGFFFGIAFASIFQPSLQFYFCLLFGALIIPLVTKAAFEVLQHWKLTPLIISYILIIWLFWLCADNIGLQPVIRILPWSSSLYDSLFSTFLPNFYLADSYLVGKFWKAILYSTGQIFFFKNSLYGLSLLLLVTAFDLRKGFYFFMGTALATLVFFSFTNDQLSWEYGTFSYSAGLVGLGLASMLEKFNWKTIMLFCVLSLFITMAASYFLIKFNLPLLSLPYVITFWFARLSNTPRLNVSWAPSEVI
jgi:urea transporter